MIGIEDEQDGLHQHHCLLEKKRSREEKERERIRKYYMLVQILV